MRVIALLALVFGFMMQLILDGQTFTHAVFGIVCGVAAFVCGLGAARKDPPNRWIGRIMAGFDFALGVWCGHASIGISVSAEVQRQERGEAEDGETRENG
jgi:hypothetical protein